MSHVIVAKTRRRNPTTLLLAAALLVALTASAAEARDVWFLGIGNDGFFSDAQGIYNEFSPHWTAGGDTVNSNLLADRDGPTLIGDLAWLTSNAGAGDLAVFYYSGHSATVADANGDEALGTALTANDETVGLQSGGNATDDQVADALAGIHPDASLLVMFDTCFAGGFVGGTQDLDTINTLLFLGGSLETENSFSGSPYSRFTNSLVDTVRATPNGWAADADTDGMLTFDELFGHAAAITIGQTPVAYTAGGASGDYAVFVTPEPATIVLLAAGIVPLVFRRRRA